MFAFQPKVILMPEQKKRAALPAREKSLLKSKIRKDRKTPRFKRQELWAQATLKDTWRRPRGKHSKMRKQERGRGRIPKPGYGSPAAVKGLNRQGFREVRVFNVSEMLGPIMLALHNIVFYHNLMDKIRKNIENGTFKTWAQQAMSSPAYGKGIETNKNMENIES